MPVDLQPDNLKEFYGPNAGYIQELFERYLADPESVDTETRAFFQSAAEPRPGEQRAARITDSESPAVDGRPAPAQDGRGDAARLPVADAMLVRRSPTESAGPPAGRDAWSVPALERREAPPVSLITGATSLANAIREYGHLASRLDPLGSDPPGDRELSPETHRIHEADLASLPSSVVGGPASRGSANALEAIHRLRQIYCGTTGYDYDAVQIAEERAWLRDAAEIGRFRMRMTNEAKRELLQRLTEVEAFEQFLHRTFPGQKRFSIEGVDALVPLLDQVIRCQTQRGNREVLLAMAHRGRLNVLAHVLSKPYRAIIAEFERPGARPAAATSDAMDEGWMGDVKYHLGARRSGQGQVVEVAITLAPNPSHLEFIDPVVEGMARAAQDRHVAAGPPIQEVEAALPILIHGDAAFPGEGVVAETLNLSRLAGYQTGGTIHIIVNNQIGFTTLPGDARSTLYASDLAKGFEIPIVHVNADDPEACLAAARLACAYRDTFHKDFLIDVVGYRRWGHNEGDEPQFTQPEMYEAVRTHPTVRLLWAAELIQQEVVTPEEVEEMYRQVMERLDAAAREPAADGEHEGNGSTGRSTTDDRRQQPDESRPSADSLSGPPALAGRLGPPPVDAETLRELNRALLELPEGFTLHSRLGRLFERRRKGLEEGGEIDWAHAETLAYASIVAEGTPIRLTGQDVARGTFSQRHLVLHDSKTGATFIPVQSMPQARASFAVYNSPLSEMAPLGFEYGYSVNSPGVLVLWEAQFGDFVNVAQVIVDQFIVSGRAKWRQSPGLVLLLPHGYEGQGPEHSSARLERFLQIAADDNLRIVNPTNAAQYFHVLRRQASLLRHDPRPLIVMTPKSLLRHPGASARPQNLTEGGFQRVLVDAPVAGVEAAAESSGDANAVTRLILCSGKFFYELLAGPEEEMRDSGVRIARVEELFPFPHLELARLIARYPRLREVVWAQEEPENMGAWIYMAPRVQELLGSGVDLVYVGRTPRASPAEGSAEAHAAEQRRIVAAAWGRERVGSRRRR
jgi:2-oxoglutarate dehydrogenase E1 component